MRLISGSRVTNVHMHNTHAHAHTHTHTRARTQHTCKYPHTGLNAKITFLLFLSYHPSSTPLPFPVFFSLGRLRFGRSNCKSPSLSRESSKIQFSLFSGTWKQRKRIGYSPAFQIHPCWRQRPVPDRKKIHGQSPAASFH